MSQQQEQQDKKSLQDDQVPAPQYVVQWKATWNDFNRALRSPQPFSQWYWLRRLVLAGGTFLYGWTGLQRFAVSCGINKQLLQSFIPLIGMGLVGISWWSYLASLRPLLRQGWCQDEDETKSCTREQIHSAFIAYVIFMITWHYLMTCFSSPGVALPANCSETTSWKARLAQGGFCGLNPPFNQQAERERVALYGTLDDAKAIRQRPPLPADNASWEFPPTNPSYCEKCDIVRPPRCHHCKVCNRCTLQV